MSAGLSTDWNHLDLKPEALALREREESVADWVAQLADRRYYCAGVRVLAHALPLVESVWWGCLCVFDALGAKLADEQDQRLRSVLRWVAAPHESQRLQVESLGHAESCDGCLALAVSSAQNVDRVPALVEASVLMAAEGLAHREAAMRDWLHIGLQVARGTLPLPGVR